MLKRERKKKHIDEKKIQVQNTFNDGMKNFTALQECFV